MKKETRQLRERAVNSLVLSIEHFNRPSNRGRVEAVLIMLNHSLEMLLKAAIVHRNGRIRRTRERETIGFASCVRKGLSDASIRFLTKEQAIGLQSINGQRDAAEHYLVQMSEHQLHFYAQVGVTLFRDIHDDVFSRNVVVELPDRVLPISTVAPRDLITLFSTEIDEIRTLLAPGKRRKMDAMAKARSMALLEGAISGDYGQPSNSVLTAVCKRLSDGEGWENIFPGIASIQVSASFDGPTISLRLTKNEGTPVRLVDARGDETVVVGVRKVNELDFYSLGAIQLAQKVGLTPPKSRAVVDHLGIRDDREFFKEIRIGQAKYARYSPKAIKAITGALDAESVDAIWTSYRQKQKQKQRQRGRLHARN